MIQDNLEPGDIASSLKECDLVSVSVDRWLTKIEFEFIIFGGEPDVILQLENTVKLVERVSKASDGNK